MGVTNEKNVLSNGMKQYVEVYVLNQLLGTIFIWNEVITRVYSVNDPRAVKNLHIVVTCI